MYRCGLVSLVLVATFSSALRSADKPEAPDTRGVQIGAKPALRLTEASGEGDVNIRSLRGSLVLVHFWDPHSPASREDVRGVAAVQERYGRRGLEVIGVVVAPEGDSLEASEVLATNWPQARVSSTAENSVLGDWLGEPPFDLPQRFLIAPDGALIWSGEPAAELEPAVREGLAEHPPFRNLEVEATRELIQNGRVILLDVRTPGEFAAGHLEGAVNIDIMRKDFAEAVRRLPQDHAYLVYCKSGGRSTHACEIMSNLQFEQLRNLQGGITAWQETNLPVVGED